MEGNQINTRIRARSNAGEPPTFEFGGLGDVAVYLVSCLLADEFDPLLRPE